MAKGEIFDTSMCCSTGVGGSDVDPALSRFAADIEWLAAQVFSRPSSSTAC